MYTILIIEDDSSCSDVMSLILQLEGFHIHSTQNGRLGLDLLREKHFDLILCDIMMMEMDGHSVLEALISDHMLADIPFIFVTALASYSDVRRGMSSGADDYLPKPFSAEELLAAVIGRIRRHQIINGNHMPAEYRLESEILRTNITKREREVLLLVGYGITSRAIAKRFGVTLKTIEVHRANLMTKLDAPNAASLARWAVIAELVEKWGG